MRQQQDNERSAQDRARVSGKLSSPGCQDSHTLTDHQGFVVSDWDAQHAGVATALSGMDMAMPYTYHWGKKLLDAVHNGSFSEHRLTDMATRYGVFFLMLSILHSRLRLLTISPESLPRGIRWAKIQKTSPHLATAFLPSWALLIKPSMQSPRLPSQCFCKGQ